MTAPAPFIRRNATAMYGPPLLIGAIYLATRLPFLMQSPVFLDEALHVDFAKRAMYGNWNVGLSLGKWLSIQSYAIVFRLLDDTLFCARLFSVALGLMTVILLMIHPGANPQRRSSTAGLTGAVMFILLPYSVFYDRLALVDQTQTTLLALVLLVTYRLLLAPSQGNRIILAFGLMALPMFKYSGFFLLPIPVVVTLILSPRGKRLSHFRQLMMAYAMATPALVFFYFKGTPAGEKGKLLNFSNLDATMAQITKNGVEFLNLFKTMLSPSLAITLLTGSLLALGVKTYPNKRHITALLVVFVIIASPYVLLFNHWYPRYLLPTLVPICLLGGELVSLSLSFGNPLLRRLAIAMVISVAVATSYDSSQIVLHPDKKPDLPIIRSLYLSGWTSGYGLTNAVAAINQCAGQHKGPIRVVRSSLWDHPFQGLNLYSDGLATNVKRVLVYHWKPEYIANTMREIISNGSPVYLLFNGALAYPVDKAVINAVRENFTIHEVVHFDKPGNSPGLVLWQVSLPSPHATSVTTTKPPETKPLD